MHRCAAARLCHNKIRENNKWVGATIDKPHGLCDRCLASVRHAYRQATQDYWDLDLNIGEKIVRADTGKVGGTPEPPMPLNGAILALQSTLSEYCEASVILVSERLNVTPERRQKKRGHPVRDYPPIVQARRIIPDNLDVLLEADAIEFKRWDSSGTSFTAKSISGIEAAIGLWKAHQQVEVVLGTQKKRTRLAMPCPVFDCGRKTLGIDSGSADITCTACGGRWTDREYQWLSNLLIEDIKNKEDNEMLNWLLAEAKWKLEQAELKLGKFDQLTKLTKTDLEGIESWSVVAIVKEILDK